MLTSFEQLIELREFIEGLYKLTDELAAKDVELKDVNAIARKYVDEHQAALLVNNELVKEIAVLKSFIVDHVPEDKQKLIFVDRSDS